MENPRRGARSSGWVGGAGGAGGRLRGIWGGGGG